MLRLDVCCLKGAGVSATYLQFSRTKHAVWPSGSLHFGRKSNTQKLLVHHGFQHGHMKTNNSVSKNMMRFLESHSDSHFELSFMVRRPLREPFSFSTLRWPFSYSSTWKSSKKNCPPLGGGFPTNYQLFRSFPWKCVLTTEKPRGKKKLEKIFPDQP